MAPGRAISPRWLHRHQLVAPGRAGRRLYNKRGTCEQWIKQGKGAIKWTRLSCCSFAANAAPRRLVSDHCIVRHGRYVIFQIRSAEGIVPRDQTLALPEAIKSSASGAGLQSRQLHADRSSAISRRIWRGGDCGLREKPDGHVFKGDRWEECVQMPRKMARSDPRPPSGLPVVAAVVRAANPPWQNTGYS